MVWVVEKINDQKNGASPTRFFVLLCGWKMYNREDVSSATLTCPLSMLCSCTYVYALAIPMFYANGYPHRMEVQCVEATILFLCFMRMDIHTASKSNVLKRRYYSYVLCEWISTQYRHPMCYALRDACCVSLVIYIDTGFRWE